MAEALSVCPETDVVYSHNHPIAISTYLAAKVVRLVKEMGFVGIDAIRVPAGGIRNVIDRVTVPVQHLSD